MINHYTCPVCQQEFADHSRHIKKFRDERQNLGCPHCKTFLLKSVESIFPTWLNWIIYLLIWGGLWFCLHLTIDLDQSYRHYVHFGFWLVAIGLTIYLRGHYLAVVKLTPVDDNKQ
ncbi:hypothetical protein HR060_15820 [Catenovulum sp. SM1970]|nr:hypothetical protein [Marinifaba aquimaris]